MHYIVHHFALAPIKVPFGDPALGSGTFDGDATDSRPIRKLLELFGGLLVASFRPPPALVKPSRPAAAHARLISRWRLNRAKHSPNIAIQTIACAFGSGTAATSAAPW